MTNSAKQIVFNYLRKYHTGDEFHSYDLKNRLLANSGIMTMDSTMTRYLRAYRSLYGVDIECIDRSKSLYKIM